MSQFKEDMINLIKALPEDSTYDDLYYHLYLRQKVQRGIAAAEDGQVVSQDDAERRMDEWLDPSGPTPP